MFLKHAASLCLLPLLCTPSGCGSSDATGVASGAECDSKLTYKSFGRAFMTEYCTACHASTLAAAQRRGAPSDHNFDTLAEVRATDAEHIDATAAAGPQGVNIAMPPEGYPMPSDKQRTQLGQWLACGAP
jgi:uncharacterized membrane protein